MKQGTIFSMPVMFENLNVEDVEKIEFIFKEADCLKHPPLKISVYPSDVTLVDGKYLIPWDKAETYLVKGGQRFYMDTRIHIKGSIDNPETEIVELTMNKTLFSPSEVYE